MYKAPCWALCHLSTVNEKWRICKFSKNLFRMFCAFSNSFWALLLFLHFRIFLARRNECNIQCFLTMTQWIPFSTYKYTKGSLWHLQWEFQSGHRGCYQYNRAWNHKICFISTSLKASKRLIMDMYYVLRMKQCLAYTVSPQCFIWLI